MLQKNSVLPSYQRQAAGLVVIYMFICASLPARTLTQMRTCTCTWTRTSTRTHPWRHPTPRACRHVHMLARMHTCSHARTQAYAHPRVQRPKAHAYDTITHAHRQARTQHARSTRLPTYIYTCAHPCVRATPRVRTCTHMQGHTHTHTHTHTLSLSLSHHTDARACLCHPSGV